MTINVVVLAAGQGVRMKSSLPKVLHPLGGRPLIQYSLQAAASLTDELPVVVVGNGADLVRQTVGNSARFALQAEQLGTAHALASAAPVLEGQEGWVVVISADMPLLTAETLQSLVDTQRANSGPMTILTIESENARGFGRVVRGPDGAVQKIVEEAQATPEILAIRELNAGAYCFQASWLWPALRRIKLSPKGEYYLTDTLELAVTAGLAVQAVRAADPEDAMGINTRVHLAEAEAIQRRRVNTALMLAGVTLVNPSATYIESTVQIGRDTVIWPNTYLRGRTIIGENCQIGPDAVLEDTRIGNNCTVLAAVLEKAVLEDEAEIGPFGHLRKGAHLGRGVHMGNFGEVKNSYLGPGVKMGHFSYIGDAVIGENTNIGCGTVTCNFDGEHKHKTQIGADVFIGSDTMLVAPLQIGDGAKTGAGAVVTHDIPAGVVVVGVPARPLKKKE